MTKLEQFNAIISKHQHIFHPVVEFDPLKDELVTLDFTENNTELTEELLEDTSKFSSYINQKLSGETANRKFGIGGYGEHRTVYSRSALFNDATSSPYGGGLPNRNAGWAAAEPRRLHLGTDIWAKAGTEIFTPLGGVVHSFAFNDQFGDYGVTIILLHQLDGFPFYTLYGHLSLKDIATLHEGNFFTRGARFAHIGEPEENGHWPPHLHFQIIFEVGIKRGDYPGVCKFSEREKYLANCPDPDLILQLNQYIGHSS